MKHTPTPWRHARAVSGHQAIYDADGKELLVRFGEGQDEFWKQPKNAKANAAFVVRAVNAHDGLVAALKNVAMDMESMRQDAQSASVRHCASESLKLIKAALAKV